MKNDRKNKLLKESTSLYVKGILLEARAYTVYALYNTWKWNALTFPTKKAIIGRLGSLNNPHT